MQENQLSSRNQILVDAPLAQEVRIDTLKLTVHPLQRPYVWTVSTVRRFLGDLALSSDRYIGTIVVNEQLEILDGQQRYLTLKLWQGHAIDHLVTDVESRYNLKAIRDSGLFEEISPDSWLPHVYATIVTLPKNMAKEYLRVNFGEPENHIREMSISAQLKTHHFNAILSKKGPDCLNRLAELDRSWRADKIENNGLIENFFNFFQLALSIPRGFNTKSLYTRIEDQAFFLGADPLARFKGRLGTQSEWSELRPYDFEPGEPFFSLLMRISAYRELYERYFEKPLGKHKKDEAMMDEARSIKAVLEIFQTLQFEGSTHSRHKMTHGKISMASLDDYVSQYTKLFLFALIIRVLLRFPDGPYEKIAELSAYFVLMAHSSKSYHNWDYELMRTNITKLHDLIDFSENVSELVFSYKRLISNELIRCYGDEIKLSTLELSKNEP